MSIYVTIAMEIEPLEQVIDLYTEVIRQNTWFNNERNNNVKSKIKDIN